MRKFVIAVTAGFVNILVAIVVVPIKKLNASTIINAINAEIRSVYNDDGK